MKHIFAKNHYYIKNKFILQNLKLLNIENYWRMIEPLQIWFQYKAKDL
jgi:hypothetical protein